MKVLTGINKTKEIKKTKSWVLEKINKIGKAVVNLTLKNKNIQSIMKMIISASNLITLLKLMNFLTNWPDKTHTRNRYLNKHISIEEIKIRTSNIPNRKQKLDILTVKLYHTWKEEVCLCVNLC